MLTPPRRSAPTLATSGRRGRIDRPVQAFLEPARALDSQPAAQVLEIGVVILSEIPKSRTRLFGPTTSFSHPRRDQRPSRRGYHQHEPAAKDYRSDHIREKGHEVIKEKTCKARVCAAHYWGGRPDEDLDRIEDKPLHKMWQERVHRSRDAAYEAYGWSAGAVFEHLEQVRLHERKKRDGGVKASSSRCEWRMWDVEGSFC